MLTSGIIDLILAAIILAGLPGTAAWALGLLVGINMLFGGTALIAMAMHARSDPSVPPPAPKTAVAAHYPARARRNGGIPSAGQMRAPPLAALSTRPRLAGQASRDRHLDQVIRIRSGLAEGAVELIEFTERAAADGGSANIPALAHYLAPARDRRSTPPVSLERAAGRYEDAHRG